MTFKITDEEYAVLREIRKNKSTSIDRLKMMFYDSAQSAVSNLEAYDLIRADFPRTDCYYATEAGLNYRHTIPNGSRKDQKNSERNNVDTKKNSDKRQPTFRHVFGYIVGCFTIAGVIIALIALLHQCANTTPG